MLCRDLPEDILGNQVLPSPLLHSDTSFLSLQLVLTSPLWVPGVLAHAQAFLLSLDAHQVMLWGFVLRWQGPGPRTPQFLYSDLEGLPVQMVGQARGRGLRRWQGLHGGQLARALVSPLVLISPSGCRTLDKSLILSEAVSLSNQVVLGRFFFWGGGGCFFTK